MEVEVHVGSPVAGVDGALGGGVGVGRREALDRDRAEMVRNQINLAVHRVDEADLPIRPDRRERHIRIDRTRTEVDVRRHRRIEMSDDTNNPLPGPFANTGVKFTTATSPGAPATPKHTRAPGAAVVPPLPMRVSTVRLGVASGLAGVKLSIVIVPRWSATRSTWLCTELTKHTCPSAPIGANATFGSTEPAPKLTFDATGGCAMSDDTNNPLPGPFANTGVKFTTATSPGSPATPKHTRAPGAIVAPPIPMRVSTVRSGVASGLAGVKLSIAIVPRWSATRSTWLCTELTKQTCPSDPIGANATFGSTEPAPKLTFDATGGCDDVRRHQQPVTRTLRQHRRQVHDSNIARRPATPKHNRCWGTSGPAPAAGPAPGAAATTGTVAASRPATTVRMRMLESP